LKAVISSMDEGRELLRAPGGLGHDAERCKRARVADRE
jgi:hypothetical protein